MGAVRYGLPAGYKRLEYLEFTGPTTIRLAVPVNNLFGLYFDYEKSLPVRTNDFPISWQKGNPYRAFRLVCDETYGGFGWWENKNNLEYKTPGGYRALWRANFQNNRILSVDSADHGHAEMVLSDIDCDYDEVVFGRLLWLETKKVEQYAYFKAYAIKLSSGSKVVYDLIPALDPTGAPCMFDTVSRTPFYNSGTGDFLYPNMVTQATTYSLRNRMYAKMTEHGIRRLYHVPQGCEKSKEEYAEQNGFKLLVETPAPEEGYWTPVWYDRVDYIELEWVETAPPEESLTE